MYTFYYLFINLIFGTGSCMSPRLALNSGYSCLSPPSARITSMYHHANLIGIFYWKCNTFQKKIEVDVQSK